MTARRLLLFRTGRQVFAVDAGAVREVLPAMPSTRIPGAPPAVRGLVNVRGSLVTVVDAARAIGLGVETAPAGPVVVVEQHARPVGLAVDEVIDLATVSDAALDGHGRLPGVRADLVRAVGSAGGLTFAYLATDVLLTPLLP